MADRSKQALVDLLFPEAVRQDDLEETEYYTNSYGDSYTHSSSHRQYYQSIDIDMCSKRRKLEISNANITNKDLECRIKSIDKNKSIMDSNNEDTTKNNYDLGHRIDPDAQKVIADDENNDLQSSVDKCKRS